MFLSNEPKDLMDFFQATQFIPPADYGVEYFIVPASSGFMLPSNSDFAPEMKVDPNSDPAFITPCETICYSRQKPIEKISQERSNPDYAAKPEPLKRTPPIRQQVMPSTDTLSLGSPFVRKVTESSLVLLKEFGPFPRNTLFGIARIK
jgi:hypothetical protein